MDRAEQRALEVFPINIQGTLEGEWDLNEESRDIFIQGYRQAEKDSILEKFKELLHFNSSYEIEDDWAYTPNLYHFDGEWHVTWIHCEDGNTFDDFAGSTPEEAINKAYNWFRSKFSKD